jgi:hypothetical protein
MRRDREEKKKLPETICRLIRRLKTNEHECELKLLYYQFLLMSHECHCVCTSQTTSRADLSEREEKIYDAQSGGWHGSAEECLVSLVALVLRVSGPKNPYLEPEA